jgi:UDP-glucose 4-epimerase
MRAFVTGGAGFIGSHLVDRLLDLGDSVTCFDDFSTGKTGNISGARKSATFTLHHGDIVNPYLGSAISGHDIVYHFAANADVRHGPEHPTLDFHANTLATMNVLEAMRANGIKRIAYASSASVYGEPEIPTPENAPKKQTSLYGASKSAAEGFIEAYCEAFGFEATILRFVSVLGPRYPHGHVLDFYKQLKEHPDRLDILGDGNQRKSYIHIADAIEAVITASEERHEGVKIYNVGTDDMISVYDSAMLICREMACDPEIVCQKDPRGWIGDNPNILLNSFRLKAMGWQPYHSIVSSVRETVRWLMSNS